MVNPLRGSKFHPTFCSGNQNLILGLVPAQSPPLDACKLSSSSQQALLRSNVASFKPTYILIRSSRVSKNHFRAWQLSSSSSSNLGLVRFETGTCQVRACKLLHSVRRIWSTQTIWDVKLAGPPDPSKSAILMSTEHSFLLGGFGAPRHQDLGRIRF